MSSFGLKFTVATALVLAAAANTSPTSAQQKVEVKGQTAKVKINQVVSGHLSELNGKYQLRVSEATFEPGGSVALHHHAGPGIRCVTVGELTFTLADGKATIYKAGDCFYESGDLAHTARNATGKPLVLLNFEILPASLKGGSIMPVPAAK